MTDSPQPSPEQPAESAGIEALSLKAVPLYSMFFLWGLGTGAQQLGRPLFAAAFGVPVFLVTLLGASNSAAWLVIAPLTGFMTDRFGRRPLVIAGNIIRGVTCVLQFFSTGYWQFFILEFLGAIGVSMWATGSSIVMADITERENRGRANAVRGISARLGSISGPLVGAILAPMFGLKALFMFNAITKIPIHLLMIYLIKETRPEEPTKAADDASKNDANKLDFRVFLSPPIIVVAMATLAYSMVGFQGILGTLFPLHVQDVAGLNVSDVGTMMSLAGTVGLLVSYPNGMFVDRFGRKKSMVIGLLFLGLAAYQLRGVTDYTSVLLMIVIYGIGDGMSQGSSEVYAMDLAPTKGRGTFLGIWSLLRNVGGISAPLIIGTVAQQNGLPIAFGIVAVILTINGVLVAIFGREPNNAKRVVAG